MLRLNNTMWITQKTNRWLWRLCLCCLLLNCHAATMRVQRRHSPVAAARVHRTKKSSSTTLHYQLRMVDQRPWIAEQIETLDPTSSLETVESPRCRESWERPWILPLGVLAMGLSSSVIGSSSSGSYFLRMVLEQWGMGGGVGMWLSSMVLPVVVSSLQKIIWIEVWRQVWDYIDIGYHGITILDETWPQWMRQFYDYGQGVIQRGTEKLMKKSMEQTVHQWISTTVSSLWSSISSCITIVY